MQKGEKGQKREKKVIRTLLTPKPTSSFSSIYVTRTKNPTVSKLTKTKGKFSNDIQKLLFQLYFFVFILFIRLDFMQTSSVLFSRVSIVPKDRWQAIPKISSSNPRFSLQKIILKHLFSSEK